MYQCTDFSGLQEQVFTQTWKSITSHTQKPFSTSTTSPMTRSRSSPWLRLCILAAIVQTTYTTSSACFITKASCSDCTPRTSTDWRNVSEKQLGYSISVVLKLPSGLCIDLSSRCLITINVTFWKTQLQDWKIWLPFFIEASASRDEL